MSALARSVVLAWLLVATAHAQRYSFKEYAQESGLGNLDVYCLLQDRTGFLWAGTQNGLYRYDGRQFRTYTKAQGLPSSQIAALHQSADGEIWVGTPAGLARLNGDRFELVRNWPAVGALVIDSDSAGNLYIGTNLGLMVSTPPPLNGQRKFRRYSVAAGGAGPQHVYAVVAESPVRVWFTCGLEICRLDHGEAQSLTGLAAPRDSWRGLLLDRQGTLWARSYSRLIALDGRAAAFVRRDEGLPPSARNAAVLMDRAGDVYVPTSSGLARRTDSGWSLIRRVNGLPSASVNYFLEDREGNAWIALEGGLVRWLGYKTAETWTESEGLSHDWVWSLRRDERGTLWAATQAGVSALLPKAGRWQARRHPVLGSGAALAMTSGGGGSWWLAQAPGGVVHVDSRLRNVTRYSSESGLTNEWIYALAADPEGGLGGSLWVGTGVGVFRGRPRANGWRFEPVPVPGDKSRPVQAMLLDAQESLWVGTSAGLSRRQKNGRWTQFHSSDGLLSNNVTHIAEGPDHALWVGYRDPIGISRVQQDGDGLKVRHFGKQDGMTPAKAYFVGFDHRGWLWVGTDMGVDRYDGKAWLHLDKTDGLAVDDCDQNAFFADTDGSVWIGTSKGLTHFLRPRPGGTRHSVAPVVLTSFELGSVAAPLEDGIEVPYSRRSFNVGFAALTFRNEDTVRFRHRLLGLDSTWTETRQTEAHYPGLPPGRFSLEVQAYTEGKWGASTARVSFRVLPPWWRTWWALSGGAILLVLSARFLWAWRVRSILHRQLELERAVEDRTYKLALEQRHALEEQARAEREKAIVEQQKVEIEHLLQESQQAARAKSEFLANISHEIRTPLNGIMGMTDLVLQTPLMGDQSDCLRLVKVAADALMVVINDVLDFSRIEAGRVELESVEFDLPELLRDTFAPLALTARQKGLDFWHRISPAGPMRILGDPGRLRQILLNLAGNAVKFTETGEIGVLAEIRTLSDGSRDLYFQIRDTGIGIPHEKQALIFEPFRQADGSTSRSYGGTGLGLSICARLVGMMGGEIWVDSQPGAGSTFHFTADIAFAAEPVSAPSGQAPVLAVCEAPLLPSGLRILIAEDNLVNQTLARRVLERAGCTVVCALDGCEVLDALAAQRNNVPFDLVLMDVQMPVMDGVEATMEWRRREAGSAGHVPIVALTANAMPGDRERCLAAGMDGFVSKPMKRDDLFHAILAGLKTAATLHPAVAPELTGLMN